jgi:hypothetical protein
VDKEELAKFKTIESINLSIANLIPSQGLEFTTLLLRQKYLRYVASQFVYQSPMRVD